MGVQRLRELSAKVGIITIHRIANYGSVLQTYALQRCISDLGYECEVIDYIYPNSYHQKINSTDRSSERYLSKLRKGIVKWITMQIKRDELFNKFILDYIVLSKCQYKTKESIREYPPKYDVYISGSDQVWNTKYLNEDLTFLLDFAPKKAKRISYAASFGQSSFDQRFNELYQNHLCAFSHISVREDTGRHIIRDLINKESCQVLDPSMLLVADKWSSLSKKPKLKNKYILCYFLGYAFNPQPYADLLAKQFSKVTGYKLVFIMPDIFKIFDPTIQTVFDAGPKEFLGWFANAEMILTTSFHGTSFSIIFNKPFFSLVDDKLTLDCRQKSLLTKLHLNDQILPINSPLPDLSRLNIDYVAVNNLLEVERKKSIDYLLSSLED